MTTFPPPFASFNEKDSLMFNKIGRLLGASVLVLSLTFAVSFGGCSSDITPPATGKAGADGGAGKDGAAGTTGAAGNDAATEGGGDTATEAGGDTATEAGGD